jgi:hypothetical protein
MVNSVPGREPLSDEDRLLAAAAYQADRVRAAASNLAGWTVAYLKSKTRAGAARDVAAREFAEGAVTFAGTLIWYDLDFVGRGGWCSQARMASAVAHQLVLDMPEVYSRAVKMATREPLSLEQARTIAAAYATWKTAATCLEVCRLSPKLFDGPDGSSRREWARLEWRKLHRVAEPPPAGADERLKLALERMGSERIPTPLPITLGEPDDEPIVRGRRKKRLTPGQYRLIKALIDAHPDRIPLDTLASRSNVSDPVGMIDRLRNDIDWAAVLDKPGQAHGGYGLRCPNPKKPRNT